MRKLGLLLLPLAFALTRCGTGLFTADDFSGSQGTYRLDDSFASGGRFRDFGGTGLNESATTVMVRNDLPLFAGGKMGSGIDSAYWFLLENGTLDPSKTGGGRPVYNYAAAVSDFVTGLVLRSDGQFFASINALVANPVIQATLDPNGNSGTSNSQSGTQPISALATATDGSICVVVGHNNGMPAAWNFAGCATPPGAPLTLTPAPTGGTYTFTGAAFFSGRIYVTGFAVLVGPTNHAAAGSFDFSGGTSSVSFDSSMPGSEGRALLVTPGGMVTIAGYTTDGGDHRATLFGLTTSISSHPGFNSGSGRLVLSTSSSEANALVLMPDGRIAVTGYTVGSDLKKYMTVWIVSADGVLRETFRDTNFPDARGNGIALDSKNRIYVAGSIANGNGTGTDMAAWRLTR